MNDVNEDTELFEPIYFYCKYCDFEEVYNIDVYVWQSEKRMKEIQEEMNNFPYKTAIKPFKYET